MKIVPLRPTAGSVICQSKRVMSKLRSKLRRNRALRSRRGERSRKDHPVVGSNYTGLCGAITTRIVASVAHTFACTSVTLRICNALARPAPQVVIIRPIARSFAAGMMAPSTADDC
jgi:hypothetical protein